MASYLQQTVLATLVLTGLTAPSFANDSGRGAAVQSYHSHARPSPGPRLAQAPMVSQAPRGPQPPMVSKAPKGPQPPPVAAQQPITHQQPMVHQQPMAHQQPMVHQQRLSHTRLMSSQPPMAHQASMVQQSANTHPSPMYGHSGNIRPEQRLSGGRSVLETTRTMPGGGSIHAVRYGNGLTGIVEHPIKPGYSSRTYVQGGRVLYARVYRQDTFQRYGHAFSYQRLVPAMAFSAAYCEWAARPWSAPVSYRWRWDAEPWHRAYGNSFTPYSNYTSLDEWLTDYVISQSFRNAYESWLAQNAPASQPTARDDSAESGDSMSAATGPRPYWDEPDDGRRPYWEEPAANDAPAAKDRLAPNPGAAPKRARVQPGRSIQQPSAFNEASYPNATGSPPPVPSAEDSPPPLSGPMKAELNAQIKRQLAERQNPPTEDLPDSLKPGHTLFRVNSPLDVASKVSGQLCSLRNNDYIERTGDMDQNGMVPVKVKVGGAFDCAIGLATQVSVNDLEAMDSEQQQALTDALLAASKNMGGAHGLPQAPSTTPVLFAAGQTRPMPDATRTLGQMR